MATLTKEFFIPDDGIRLHAKLDRPENVENCPLAIVLHGFTGHMEERHILAVAGALNELGIATLRMELYGHGQSDGKFEDHNLYKWLNNVLTVTAYAKSLDFVTDLYLCGHSQGGLTTMLAAGMLPRTFKAIFPLSPAISILEGARSGLLLGMPFDPENIPEMLYFDDRRLRGDYVRVAQTLHVEEAIRRYRGPVLLVHGDADTSVPLRDTVTAAEQYENARLVVIKGDTPCKRKGIGEPCKCYFGDELAPIIDRIYQADRLILGSPIYFGEPTGQLRMALERIFFPALSYNTFSSTFQGKLSVDVFLTMNCPQEVYEKAYSAKMAEYFGPFHLLNTAARIHPIWDTVQVSDYSKYDMDGINGAAKQARHDAEFPAALELAFRVGAGTAEE